MKDSPANGRWQGCHTFTDDYLSYTAARRLRYRPIQTRPKDEMRLVVQGRIVDYVEYISCITRLEYDTSLFSMDTIKLSEEVSGLTLDSSHTEHSVTNRIFAILIGYADIGSNARSSQPYTIGNLQEMYRAYIETHQHDAKDESAFVKRFGYSYSQNLHKRVFSGGKMLFGLGPDAVLPGDFTCIVHGSDLPLLLRRCGNGKE